MTGRRGSCSLVACFAAACLLLRAASARAQEPTIKVRGVGGWGDALAALRADLGSEGRPIFVDVGTGGRPVPCDHYRLVLDEAAREAFRIGACDPASGATTLVLERRAALFDHAGHVPRPRVLSITANVTYEGMATGGGAREGGSAVRCSWAVRPYLVDQEHGTRVLLMPEHYALRSGSARVSATPDGAGWSLSTTESATFHLEYEVVEKATGEVVLKQKLDLTCGDHGASGPRPGPLPAPEQPPPSAAPVRYDLPRLRPASPCSKGCRRKKENVALYALLASIPSAAQGAFFVLSALEPDPAMRKFEAGFGGGLTLPAGLLWGWFGVQLRDLNKMRAGQASVLPAVTLAAGRGSIAVAGSF